MGTHKQLHDSDVSVERSLRRDVYVPMDAVDEGYAADCEEALRCLRPVLGMSVPLAGMRSTADHHLARSSGRCSLALKLSVSLADRSC